MTPDQQATAGDYTLTATIIEFTEYGRISPECDSENNADLGMEQVTRQEQQPTGVRSQGLRMTTPNHRPAPLPEL